MRKPRVVFFYVGKNFDRLYKIGYYLNKHRRWAFLLPLTIGLTETITHATMALASTSDWHVTTQFHELDSVHKHPHGGIDYAVNSGTPVRSVMEGKVAVFDEGNVSFGKSVHVYDGQGHELIYGHLNKIEVKTGDIVHVGDEVGLSGNTGHSTGSHLHVEVRINGKSVDPQPYIQDFHRLSYKKYFNEVPRYSV